MFLLLNLLLQYDYVIRDLLVISTDLKAIIFILPI